jgi:hypothetical protein
MQLVETHGDGAAWRPAGESIYRAGRAVTLMQVMHVSPTVTPI